MFGKLLLSGELKQFASFVSPAFFDVMPARQLWQRARQLLASSRDREAFRLVMAQRRDLLSRSRVAITLAAPKEDRAKLTAREASAGDALSRGSSVVSLYFHQICHGPVTLFDLRHGSFSATDGSTALSWRPAPWFVEWKAEFIEALREVYGGFYSGNDGRFQAGLRALDLSHAEPIFRRHFGGEQSRVTFRTKDFVDTFHQVFVACRDRGTSLHPDFLPLGLYLATLYEHLDELGVAIDVRGCFEQALPLKPASAGQVSHDYAT